MTRKENTNGRYGYHPQLESVVGAIRESSKGKTFKELDNYMGQLGNNVLEQIIIQAEALGMIEVANSGSGKKRRFFYAPNKQLFVNDHRNDEIVSEVRKAINELKENGLEEGKAVQISVKVADSE